MTQPTNYRAALEQALDALRSAKPTMWRHAPGGDYDRFDAAMTGIRAALLQSTALPDHSEQHLDMVDAEKMLSEIRDMFPVPATGSPLEQAWSEAMGDPASVPAYVRACVAALPVGELTDKQIDTIAGGKIDYFDRRVFARAILAAARSQPVLEPLTNDFLQTNDYYLLHRFIETTEDDESYDITKAEIKRLADLGVVQSHGFGKYSVTMFGYWVHERYWEQNPSLPLKTNTDRDAEAAHGITQGGKV